MVDSPAPPLRATRSTAKAQAAPIDAEQIRRMEEARLKAKAAAKLTQPSTSLAGTKRTYTSYNASNTPSTVRDAAVASPQKRDHNGFIPPTKDADLIQPARNFGRSEYIEYDFSKMTDTKGGFLSTTDDPHNKAMWTGNRGNEEQKPEGMTLAEWERERIRKKLRENRAGPFEPGISIFNALDGRDETELAADIAAAEAEGANNTESNTPAPPIKGKYLDNLLDVKGKCRECSTLEIDYKWQDIFGIGICPNCREKYPDKYSLLTKTEARDDYLLTDPELKDEDLLPHLERPNPHKTNWNNMQLFLRLQVETYAFSPAKWGSAEALDEEYEKRTKVAKERKEKKFSKKLEELKKRTRMEAYKRAKFGNGGEEAKFGDRIQFMGDKHVHEWGRSVLDPETGMTRKRCEECGMEVEELEF